MRKRHTWIHTENMHILSYIRATYRLTEPLREWEVGQTGAWELCLSCKQCMLVIQKIESERCFREREWIKGDPLFLIPPVVTHTRIKAVWKLRQGPKKKKNGRKRRLSAKVCWWHSKGKKKECDPFKLLCNESEIRPQAWNDNNN